MINVRAPLSAQVIEWLVKPGDPVQAGAVLVVLESMKMEHEVRADAAMQVTLLHVGVGDTVAAGEMLVSAQPVQTEVQPSGDIRAAVKAHKAPEDPVCRGDLHRLRDRLAWTEDAARPEAVSRRHAQGLRTARENIAALCDEGSFLEYGALAVAAQRSRRSEEDLMANTPADGMVTGIGSVNGTVFGEARARTVVMAYDATVLAGTQGMRNHQKTDR
ncbi:MAG: biotin carboxylase, partial [Comamonadaceae bacterium]|nr:biotin carboxylase [Comamonadaceae bacterium]